MFADVDLRRLLRSPLFYFRLFMGLFRWFPGVCVFFIDFFPKKSLQCLDIAFLVATFASALRQKALAGMGFWGAKVLTASVLHWFPFGLCPGEWFKKKVADLFGVWELIPDFCTPLLTEGLAELVLRRQGVDFQCFASIFLSGMIRKKKLRKYLEFGICFPTFALRKNGSRSGGSGDWLRGF